jgi:hypothetical protein
MWAQTAVFVIKSTVHPSPSTVVDTHRKPFLDNLGPSFRGLTFSSFSTFSKVRARETGERWPLLTVEIEANEVSRSTYERGPSLVGLLDSSCRYKIILFCLGGCSSRPSTKYFFFLTAHCFTSFVHIGSSKLGRQSCRIACLLICVSGAGILLGEEEESG